MKTIQELGIFWASKDGHEEAPGIYLYGYWGKSNLPTNYDSLSQAWQHVNTDNAFSQIDAEDGNFLVMQVRMNRWPNDSEWRSAIEGTFAEMVRLGAKVAWCGGENCSWSLQELDPNTSGGCVYAAYSKSSGLILHSELNEEISYLSDEELLSLQQGVQCPE